LIVGVFSAIFPYGLHRPPNYPDAFHSLPMNARTIKRAILRLISPIDAVARRINGKSEYPPLALRWDVGPLRGYERSAAEFRLFLQLFASLRPDSRLLDIGCGCGQMAQELAGVLSERGAYEGWDINREAIDWCIAHISSNDPRCTFQHLNVGNRLYQPTAAGDAATLRFDTSRTFDVILLKSVFTHLLNDQMQNYLRQLPGLLASGGKALVTCFLMNDERRASIVGNTSHIVFVPFAEDVFVVNPAMPEAVVGYEETAMLGAIRSAGLQLVQPVRYGSWAGDHSALTHQDLLVLGRES
jgi:SAM-dependent methyltransferase